MVWRVRVGNQTAPYSKEIKENMCSLFHETETIFFSFARGARLQVHATPVVEISKQIHSTASVLHLSSAFDCKLVTIEIKWCTVLLDSYCSWERYGTRGPVFERRGMAGGEGNGHALTAELPLPLPAGQSDLAAYKIYLFLDGFRNELCSGREKFQIPPSSLPSSCCSLFYYCVALLSFSLSPLAWV